MADIRRVWVKSLVSNLEIVLPITPFITFKESVASTSQDLFGFGEYDGGGTPKLDTWSCESFFPDLSNNYSFDKSRVKYTSGYYVQVFSKWLKEQHALEFQYYTDTKTINKYYCKLTGFTHGERNGSKNIYYTLDFKEYKELTLKNNMIVNSEQVIKSYGSSTYYVGYGDTLVSIAAKLYGDSSKWAYLMTKNGLKNPLDIQMGQKLLI